MSLDNPDSTLFEYLAGGIGAAFVTMGSGFLYVMGRIKDVQDTKSEDHRRIWERLGQMSQQTTRDQGATALEIEKRFATKADLAAMESRLAYTIHTEMRDSRSGG